MGMADERELISTGSDQLCYFSPELAPSVVLTFGFPELIHPRLRCAERYSHIGPLCNRDPLDPIISFVFQLLS